MTKEEVLEVLREIMSDSERKIFDSYIRNENSVVKTAIETGFSENSICSNKKKVIFRRALEIWSREDGEIRDKASLPTYEWTILELKDAYERIKNSDLPIKDKEKMLDDKLKMIMSHQKAFGEFLNEDEMKVAQIKDMRELEELYRKTKEEIDKKIEEGRWWEQKKEV